MRIKVMIMFLLMLIGAAKGALAQTDSTIYFQGEWEIEKAEVKIYAQANGQLLEQRTLISAIQLQSVNAAIRSMSVSFHNCQVEYFSNVEKGFIRIFNGRILLMKQDQTGVLAEFPYRFDGSKLLLVMPSTNYYSAGHSMPVKQCVVCQLQKKP